MNPRHLAPKASALPTALHPDGFSDVVAVVVKHVVNGGFFMGFVNFLIDGNAGVSTVPGVGGFVRSGKAYTLPKQARYQLCCTLPTVLVRNISGLPRGTLSFGREGGGRFSFECNKL